MRVKINLVTLRDPDEFTLEPVMLTLGKAVKKWQQACVREVAD